MSKEDAPPKLVKRPHHRRLFGDRGRYYLVMEPHRLGLAGAAVITTLVLVVYSLATWGGAQYGPAQILVGAGATFVVSYAAVGVFVWYVLHVSFRELGPPPEHEQRRRSLVAKKRAAREAAQAAQMTDLDRLAASVTVPEEAVEGGSQEPPAATQPEPETETESN